MNVIIAIRMPTNMWGMACLAVAQLIRADAGLEDYIPVLMQMARIYWDRDNYSAVEAVLRQSAEFCSEHETWKLNVAHVFFMQENNWKFAIQYYAPIVEKNKRTKQNKFTKTTTHGIPTRNDRALRLR